MNGPIVFSLKLFGGLTLSDERGPIGGRAGQRHRLALLALLGASRPRAMAREKLMALLWAERDGESARGLLNQAVHVLRQTMGAEAILSTGDDLQLNSELVRCDVAAFEEAIASGEFERAASLYAGPFLDGFFLSDAPEFERWIDRERDRLAASFATAVESLAERAESGKDWGKAVEWWKRRVALDPYHSRAVARLMLALEASGNRAAAVLQGAEHQRLLKEDLGLEPSPEVRALAERLRSEPAASAPWLSVKPAAAAADTEGTPSAGILPVPPTGAAAARSPRRSSALRYGVAALGAVAAILLIVRLSSDAAARRAIAKVPAAAVDSIAIAVARQLVRLERRDTAAVAPAQRTTNIAAYELYLRGNDPVMLRSDSAARQALDYFRRAVALDSSYAAAWAGVARLSGRTAGFATGKRRVELMDEAEAAARRALALDSSLAEVHGTFALFRMMQYDLATAESHLLRATALEPGTSLYHEYLSKLYLWTGREEAALAEAQRGLASQPRSASANAEVARALLASGKYDECLAQLQQIANLDPPLARLRGIKAQCYAKKRMWQEALALYQGSGDLGMLAYLLVRAGQRTEAARVLTSLLERSDAGAHWEIALVYLALGDVDQAVPWLDSAVVYRSIWPMTESTPLSVELLNSFRRDARIERLSRRIGLQKR